MTQWDRIARTRSSENCSSAARAAPAHTRQTHRYIRRLVVQAYCRVQACIRESDRLQNNKMWRLWTLLFTLLFTPIIILMLYDYWNKEFCCRNKTVKNIVGLETGSERLQSRIIKSFFSNLKRFLLAILLMLKIENLKSATDFRGLSVRCLGEALQSRSWAPISLAPVVNSLSNCNYWLGE